ncbi:chemotaxis protein CheB [Desulfurispora thermophila]|uniref:chemotaxis protein CheB n=1 Tax=Desulfurispora thermophila TaxID=265470 RepID=UPI00037DC38A|nr:chemotaxis protein CheB [Desulfurispora thermophila]
MKKSTAKRYEAVVLGVSAGGLNALRLLLPALKPDFSLPLVIVQHQHPAADDFLVRYLNNLCPLFVKQAEDKEEVRSGIVYLAPPDYHLLVEMDRFFSLSVDPPVNYARPAIDVLFATAADTYGSALIGVILTGASNDGSEGLKQIKQKGGLTIVQDPDTAEVDFMPRAALSAAGADYLLPLEQIAPLLNKLAGTAS